MSGSSATIASLMLVPRPASASPNSRRLTWFAARVGSSNIEKKSSNSTGLGVAFLSASVPSSGSPLEELPGVSSTYFRPIVERGRTITVESTGSGLTSVSSFTWSLAVTLPSLYACGSILSMIPTRSPPTRTSLPVTRFDAFGSSSQMLYVGTNGRPLFAL